MSPWRTSALPFRDGTNSRIYVPLLLDAAGVLSADAQRAWRSHAPFAEWWPAAVAALLARPFIPVPEHCAAVEHVSQAFPPQALASNTLLRFWSWAPPRIAQVERSSAPLPRLMKDTTSRPLCRRHCLRCWSATAISAAHADAEHLASTAQHAAATVRGRRGGRGRGRGRHAAPVPPASTPAPTCAG